MAAKDIHCIIQVQKDEIDNITNIEDYVRECLFYHPERIRYDKK